MDRLLPSERATEIVIDRQQTYGPPEQVYGVWALMMEPVIQVMFEEERTQPTTEECAMMLILLKCAREVNAGYPLDYRDNVDDIAGFANVLHMVKGAHGS